MTAALEVQKVVFDVLDQNNSLITLLGGNHVYDDVPDRRSPPYVLFGEFESLDWSTSSDEGEEHFMELEVWSSKNGRKQALEISYAVRAGLRSLCQSTPLALTVYRLVNFSVEGIQTSRVEKNKFFLSTISLRAVTEQMNA